MKRTLVALLLVAALIAPAFGQPVAVDLGFADFGQGWIYQNNESNELLPESMIAWTSNGFYMDEIDTIARAPLLFGTFTGYSVFTAYGNYESWRTVSPETPINPFDDGGSFTPGSYQVGLAMPVPFFEDWRAGFLFGQNSTFSGNLNADGQTFYLSDSTTQTFDTELPPDVIDYTTLTAYEGTDKTTSSETRIVSALNLGFMGVSLYGTIDDDSRLLGGSYEFTRTEGTNPATTIRTTSQSTYWGQSAIGTDLAGTGATGKVTSFPEDQAASFGALGQLSLFGLPITAGIGFKTVADGVNGFAYEEFVAQRVFRTQSYAADADADAVNDAAKVNTFEVLQGVDLSGVWVPSAMGTLPAATTANYSSGLTYAVDLSESGKGGFFGGLGFAVDPTFALADNVSIKPRASLGYSIGFLNYSTSRVKYGHYSLAQAGATGNTEWTYSERSTVTETGNYHDLRSQLGAALSLRSPDSNIELTSGFYALPYLTASVATPTSGTSSISRSYVNATGTPLVTPAAGTSASAAAALIGAADTTTGTSQYDATTAFQGSEVTSNLGIEFAIPVAVRFSFFDKKLSIIGGLTANYIAEVETVKETTTSSVTTETVVLNDGLAAVTFTPPDASAAHTYPTEEITKTVTEWPWDGAISLMFRWMPNETVTIDITGTSVRDAFDELDTILSLNDGIYASYLWDALDVLSLSVTFHF